MSDLPSLPKQNKQREASFGVKFREWIMKNPRYSCTFEMKDTRGKNAMPFSEITPQQRAWGLAVSSDEGVLIRVQGLSGEPDYSYYRNAPAYVVIRYKEGWAMISIETLIMEDKRSKQRSLTWKRAKDIAILVV